MCLYPKIIENRKYIANKKNGGIIPAISDIRVKGVPVGCGNCMECRKKKARDWQVRLLEDVRTNRNGIFVTLTFSNKSIIELKKRVEEEATTEIKGYEIDNRIAKKATRLFLERWRKEYKKSIRHWLVTEIGHNGTENIHLHGIMWTDKSIEDIRRIWKYGYIYPRTEEEAIRNYVSEITVNYITKYISKQDLIHKNYKSIILTSAGMGGNYINTEEAKENKHKIEKTKESYTTRTGHEISLPIYWRNKIYNDEEREKLWIEKLNKNEAWIGGEKVSRKQGNEQEFYELIEYYQAKSERLGYGNDKTDWDAKKYEEERRDIMYEERTKE